jgi:hypothetical protein
VVTGDWLETYGEQVTRETIFLWLPALLLLFINVKDKSPSLFVGEERGMRYEAYFRDDIWDGQDAFASSKDVSWSSRGS